LKTGFLTITPLKAIKQKSQMITFSFYISLSFYLTKNQKKTKANAILIFIKYF
jgi:hypothetical protein